MAELTARQRELLDGWLPGWVVVADHSWGQIDTLVLEVVCGAGRFAVKAAGPDNGHLPREIRGRRAWCGPWLERGAIGRLVEADEQAAVVVVEWLPGRLVEGSTAQSDPETYRQAGVLARLMHDQPGAWSATWFDDARERVLRFLDRPHRIDPAVERAVRAEVAGWSGGANLVPTHGDWQPRNWVVDGGIVRVIDLGRADLRPVEEDFSRLARQDFLRDPSLERAYLDGYGEDPRNLAVWRAVDLGEAVGTAVWAYGVGDVDFERVGHEHLARAVPLT